MRYTYKITDIEQGSNTSLGDRRKNIYAKLTKVGNGDTYISATLNYIVDACIAREIPVTNLEEAQARLLQHQNFVKFETDKEELLIKIESLRKDFSEFTKQVNPNNWRTTGTLYANLTKMEHDVKELTKITDEDLKIDWVRKELGIV